MQAEGTPSQVVVVVESGTSIIDGLESCATASSSRDRLAFDNKYFKCEVGILQFSDGAALRDWFGATNQSPFIGALVIRFGENDSVAHIQELINANCFYDAEQIYLVMDAATTISPVFQQITGIINQHCIETIVLDPTEEMIEEAEENCEKYGLPRLYEALQIIEWPAKTLKGGVTNWGAQASSTQFSCRKGADEFGDWVRFTEDDE
ncbi:unnamed protein product, partial [Mesorhabditis spiculigera]